ncbi:MAG: hypothetical protein H0U59_02910 [Gemmatimonadaceae bacterium]|nr:hypothetical protein [Gemmatimonadaceae bacterium]
MTEDQLEFSISQYADNTLSAGDRAALELHIDANGDARQLLAEYRALDQVIRREAPATPELDWEALAGRISAAVRDEEIPARSLRIPWRATGLAMAASILLAVGIGIAVYQGDRSSQPTSPVRPVAVVKIDGPLAEAATQPALVKIDLGPADEFAEAQYQLSEGIVQRPSRVSLIASKDDPAQDTTRSPYQQ